MSDRPTDDRPADDVPVAHPAALDYATPDAGAGVPFLVPEVEAGIDRGERLGRLARHFTRADVAAGYLTQSIQRRFSSAIVPDRCELCGAPATGLASVGWSFQVPARSLGFSAQSQAAAGGATTRHAVCDACRARWARRVAPLLRIQKAMVWLGLPFGLLLVVCIIADKFRLKVPDPLFATGGTGVAIAIVVALVAKGVEALQVPRAIRRRVPRWLRYARLNRFTP